MLPDDFFIIEPVLMSRGDTNSTHLVHRFKKGSNSNFVCRTDESKIFQNIDGEIAGLLSTLVVKRF